MSNGSHAHWSTRVTTVGLEDHIRGQCTDGVDSGDVFLRKLGHGGGSWLGGEEEMGDIGGVETTPAA